MEYLLQKLVKYVFLSCIEVKITTLPY